MKKFVSILLATIMFISCIAFLSSCSSKSKKFDVLASFISKNGVESNGEIAITKDLSELGEAWKDNTAVITISYDKTTGYITMEETIEYDGYTACYKAVCNKNSENVDVIVEYIYADHKDYYKGYIQKGSFSNTNRETAVFGFETNSAPLGEANAKATLGVSINLLLSHTKFLLINVNSPVSLDEIGFNSYFK